MDKEKEFTKKLESESRIEEQFLHMLVLNNSLIVWTKPRFDEKWLTEGLNRETYKKIMKAFETYGGVDYHILREHGGWEMLQNLLHNGNDFHFAHFKAYVKIIKKKFNYKKKHKTLRDAIQLDDEPEYIIQKLRELQEENDTTVDFNAIMEQQIKKIKSNQGKPMEFPTGIDLIDTKVGLEKGVMVIIGADTSTGKSALLSSILQCFAFIGKRILFVDLEMGEGGVANRIIRLLTAIDTSPPYINHLTKDELKSVQDTFEITKDWQLWIKSCITPDDVLANILDLKPDVVFIDYIQQMSAPYVKDNKTREMTEIAKSLQNIAIQTNVLMIVASQFARGTAAKTIKPGLHSFRESGGIENSARVALLLYRKWLYDKKADPSLIECNIAKNSNGPLGYGNLKIDFKTLLITDARGS